MIFRLLALVLLLSACATPTPPSPDVQSLMDQAWQLRLDYDPLLAERFGRPEAAAQLPDLSPETLAHKHQQELALLEQAKQIEASSLNSQEQADLAMLRYQLQNRVDRYRFAAYTMPLDAEAGFYAYLPGFARTARLDSDAKTQAYLQRLAAVPRYFDQQIAWMRQGMASGHTLPRVVLSGTADSIAAYITEPEQSPFYQPLAALDDSEAQQQGLALIRDGILPSYQAFHRFFVEEYYPAARTSIAAVELPDGEAFYANRVRHFTTLSMSVDEVHALGLQEVARIRAEMEAVIQQVEFDGSFAEFLHFLRTDPQFYAKTPRELLQYASFLAKQADASLPQFFATLPRTPYGIKPVPAAIAPKYTTGRYASAAADDQPGYYWVNTYALDKRPLYEMEALTLHEAVPGHHLQIALSQEQAMHPLRRFSYISAFGEGWGLYAEKLGLEAGFYQDPYSNFGRLTYEMWRACRLVVDTGMHAKGWSREQAVAFLADNTALSLHNVGTEIDRYIGWPGQALSYKIGELTLWRLRHQAEETLGDDFDIRHFHDALLTNGSLPLTELEQQMGQWLEQQPRVETGANQ
ncbi:DUF885 domain-containing protein [Ferrimonas marina]|uniref:Uncharacterized conserved protein, DUF885 familyt n=1 Tax=Ferrimonas marina TaxID=299255 RepID=A0A1M5XR45_9GAMM|nr:DUF885 domain-containing protein [Ferrimonas marina]SHI01733.1 Uncharacterized conserved protein, DUF885 familyt [Ferrimonas marina]